MSLLVSGICKNKYVFRLDRIRICLLSTHPNFTNCPSSSSSGQPSLKTSVIIKDIGTSATSDSLKAALTEINFRKIEVQPGCALHVISQAEADHLKLNLANELKLESMIVNTSTPTVILQNIPQNLTVSSLYQKFGAYKPNAISKFGCSTFQTVFASASDALKAAKIIASMSIENEKLHTSTVKLPDGRYLVHIYDVPEVLDGK